MDSLFSNVLSARIRPSLTLLPWSSGLGAFRPNNASLIFSLRSSDKGVPTRLRERVHLFPVEPELLNVRLSPFLNGIIKSP